MPFGTRAPGRSPGLTIIELLVVLVIFGIGWFAVLPNIDLMNASDRRNPALEHLNDFLARVRLQAMHNATIEQFTVIPGQRYLRWAGGERIALPRVVSRCLVNGRQYFDREMVFRLYPSGSMDDVRITLEGGEVLSANTLDPAFAGNP